jgi:hypothetical protein
MDNFDAVMNNPHTRRVAEIMDEHLQSSTYLKDGQINYLHEVALFDGNSILLIRYDQKDDVWRVYDLDDGGKNIISMNPAARPWVLLSWINFDFIQSVDIKKLEEYCANDEAEKRQKLTRLQNAA